ncbi:MAG: hypothetical protein F6K14_34815 [Symploca sp. SIO2C1]|nr:hypothetical protein [Symploca sp. SIO2C1]
MTMIIILFVGCFIFWKSLISQPSDHDRTGDHKEFEAIADRIADEFQTYLGGIKLSLSDYAVSRAGIYEEHP